MVRSMCRQTAGGGSQSREFHLPRLAVCWPTDTIRTQRVERLEQEFPQRPQDGRGIGPKIRKPRLSGQKFIDESSEHDPVSHWVLSRRHGQRRSSAFRNELEGLGLRCYFMEYARANTGDAKDPVQVFSEARLDISPNED